MKPTHVRCIVKGTGLVQGKIYKISRRGCCFDGPTYFINGLQYFQSWFEDVKLEEVTCETKNSK